MVNSLNIGLWSCTRCNGHKSALEDDISTITMMPGPNGEHARDDVRLARTSARKLRGSISSATRRKVSESYPELEIRMPLGNAQMALDLTGQPQIADDRAARLAWSHIQGLWFYQTYDKDQRSGRNLIFDRFATVGIFSRADWGNMQMASFGKQIEHWEYQTFACLADGYFRAIVKAAPDGESLAWAVEWNESYRVFGYWSQSENWHSHFNELSPLELDYMVGDKINGWGYRQEIPLPAGMCDGLFAHPEDLETLPEATIIG